MLIEERKHVRQRHLHDREVLDRRVEPPLGLRTGLLQLLVQQAGAKAEWRLYPSVEHLAIVQVALPDVFSFFDQHVR